MHRAKSDECEWCAKCQCCEGKRANVKSVKPNGTRRFRNRETFEKHRWACKRKHIFNGDPSLKQPNQTSEIQDPQLSDEHHNDIGTAGIEVAFTPVQHSAEVEQGMVRKPPLNFPTASDDAKWEIIDTQTFEDLQEVFKPLGVNKIKNMEINKLVHTWEEVVYNSLKKHCGMPKKREKASAWSHKDRPSKREVKLRKQKSILKKKFKAMERGEISLSTA